MLSEPHINYPHKYFENDFCIMNSIISAGSPQIRIQLWRAGSSHRWSQIPTRSSWWRCSKRILLRCWTWWYLENRPLHRWWPQRIQCCCRKIWTRLTSSSISPRSWTCCTSLLSLILKIALLFPEYVWYIVSLKCWYFRKTGILMISCADRETGRVNNGR